jgi:RHS repeat-associated protein
VIDGFASREMETRDGGLAGRYSMPLGQPGSWIASPGGLELSLSVVSSEAERDRNRDLASGVAAEELGLALEATWKRPSFGEALRFAIEQGFGATSSSRSGEERRTSEGQTLETEGGEADRGRARPALTKSQCEALCEALQLGYRWVPWRPLVPWWDVEYQPEAPGQLVLLAPLAKASSGSSPARSLPSSVLAETLSRNKCIIVQSRGQRARVRGTLAARSAASTARSETDLTLGGAFRDWLGNTDKTTDDANGFYDRSLGAVTNDGAANKPYQLKSATLSGARGGTVRAKYDDSGHMVRMDLARSGPCLPVGATCSQRFAYEWDEVGRLGRARRWDTAPGSSIDDPLPGGTPAAELRYTYDAGDQRVIKHAVDTSGESFTLYLFESLELKRSQFGTAFSDSGSGPADYEASVFAVVPYLLANGVRLARLAYEGMSEVPEVTPGTGAGEVNASVSQVHVFFELGDHLGSTSVVLDKATSELVERSTFQGYGATESDYRPGRWNAFREDYRFTGKEEDAEVGLTYFGKRYLNAYLGRWISADPLAIHAPGEADLNVYAYVSGSILKNVDPLGLCTNEDNCGGTDSQSSTDSTSESPDLSYSLATIKRDYEFLALGNASYEGRKAPSGWREVTDEELGAKGLSRDMFSTEAGFSASLYVNDRRQEFALSFRGSDTREDFEKANFPQAVGVETDQYHRAAELAGRVRDSFGNGSNLTMTGHSLGGGLAAVAAIATGSKAVTMNAAGVHASTLLMASGGGGLPSNGQTANGRRIAEALVESSFRAAYSNQITNYHIQGEIVTSLQTLPFVPSAQGRQVAIPARTSANPLAQHEAPLSLQNVRAEIHRLEALTPGQP